MFEGQTLESQRKIEVERGWKPSYSALTYCTAEAVLFRKPTGTGSVLDCEILDAERVTGAPDCVGKRQGKWGAYVKPTDLTSRHAIQRGLKETFAWDVPLEKFNLAGIVGPGLHKARVRIGDDELILIVDEEQAEQTPFEAKLFSVDVTGFDLGPDGGYAKATREARWVSLRNLVAEQGENPDYLYWLMIALHVMRSIGPQRYNLVHYFGPGEYRFPSFSPRP